MKPEMLLARLAVLAAGSPPVLDCLQALDALEQLLWAGPPLSALLLEQAQALIARLEYHSALALVGLRQAVQAGDGPTTLWPLLEQAAPESVEGYDRFDTLLSGVIEPLLEVDPAPLPPEMVLFQPTPARHIADLLRRAALSTADVLVDLGCGLGHVPLAATICTPARAIGVEIDPGYVAAARASAAALHQQRAAFICEDARAADFGLGTLFFLYTPFRGAVLRTVLDRLHQAALQRPLRVAAYGPCVPTLAAEPWLRATGPVEPGRVALFEAGA